MRPEVDDMDQTGAGGGGGWRDGLRILAAVLGIVTAVVTVMVTWRDRYEVDAGDGAAVLRATLNQGLYLERLFILGCVLIMITAIYIATRIGE